MSEDPNKFHKRGDIAREYRGENAEILPPAGDQEYRDYYRSDAARKQNKNNENEETPQEHKFKDVISEDENVAGAEDEKQKDKASVSKKMTAYVHAGPSENVLVNSIRGRLVPTIKKRTAKKRSNRLEDVCSTRESDFSVLNLDRCDMFDCDYCNYSLFAYMESCDCTCSPASLV
jgi:hypothetical protein